MNKIIEKIIEAESLNKARQIAKSELPLGYSILSEEVISEVISDAVAKMWIFR